MAISVSSHFTKIRMKPAVNRLVVGSNPTRGAIFFNHLADTARRAKRAGVPNVQYFLRPTLLSPKRRNRKFRRSTLAIICAHLRSSCAQRDTVPTVSDATWPRHSSAQSSDEKAVDLPKGRRRRIFGYRSTLGSSHGEMDAALDTVTTVSDCVGSSSRQCR